jgi:hypothetical protein
MFVSERTVILMRWHKDGETENKEVMVHPLDSDMWKTLDNIDPEFARDVRNVRIRLATDSFTHFGDNTSTSIKPCHRPPDHLEMRYTHNLAMLLLANAIF